MTPFIRAWATTAFALLSLLPGHAPAQDFDPDGVSLSIDVFDTQVLLPPPSWQRTPTGQDEHEYQHKQQGPVFIFEQIPKGESFQDWSKMQAVLGVYGAGEQNMSFAEFVNRSISQFLVVCGRDNFARQDLNSAATEVTTVIYCEDSPNAPAEPDVGYGPGVGEVALMAFRRHARTYFKIYHEWRGPSFDAANPQTWPVDQATLSEMIRRFERIRLQPAQQ